MIGQVEENSDIHKGQQKIRSLLVTNRIPYPPIGGGPMRNWQNMTILMQFGPVGIFFVSLSNDQDIISIVSKPPGIVFLSINVLADFPSNNMSWSSRVTSTFQPKKHYMTENLYRSEIDTALSQILYKFSPDLVVFDDPWLYRYLPSVKRRGCFIVLDEHNIEAPLFLDKRKSSNACSRIRLNFDSIKLKAIEKEFIHQVDQVWMCSDSDVSLAHELYGASSNIRVVPNGVRLGDYEAVRLGKCDLPDNLKRSPWIVLFPANFGYIPNQAAAQFLIEQIFPRLQEQYPHCSLILAGRSPTQQMLEAAENNSDIFITGLVEDMRPYLAICSVMIVPLLTGGGTRLKILEAFASGRPVVSTAKGAEGITAQNNQHLLIRDSVNEIVSGVCELWEDSSLAQTLVQYAYKLVEDQYSWTSLRTKIEENLRALY